MSLKTVLIEKKGVKPLAESYLQRLHNDRNHPPPTTTKDGRINKPGQGEKPHFKPTPFFKELSERIGIKIKIIYL
jgi:hypothetical protein